MKMIPETEIIVSNNDHVRNVSFTVKPKYSLNIQNPRHLHETKSHYLHLSQVQLMQHLHLMIVIMVRQYLFEIAATVAEPNAIRSTANNPC